MKQFEYDITVHDAKFFKTIAFFCTNTGQCSAEEIDRDQRQVLGELLNQRGAEGWELVQLVFRKEGVIAFWKREK